MSAFSEGTAGTFSGSTEGTKETFSCSGGAKGTIGGTRGGVAGGIEDVSGDFVVDGLLTGNASLLLVILVFGGGLEELYFNIGGSFHPGVSK